MKKEVVNIIKDLAGNEYLYFDDALIVKLTPHTWPLLMWAVCVSPAGYIYLMDNKRQWHVLEERDVNYDRVLSTLYQRMKTIQRKQKTIA